MKRFSPSAIDTFENPVKRGQSRLALGPFASKNMITCWQNGRRVLMHSSEVAKMMKKPTSSCAGLTRASMMPRNAFNLSMDCNRTRVCASAENSMPRSGKPGPGVKRSNDEEKMTGSISNATFGLTPLPILPRNRSLAQNESWQLLAKEMARLAGQPQHCHKPACRRAKRCAGGVDACYLREFVAVDVAMQRDVLPAIRRAAGGAS